MKPDLSPKFLRILFPLVLLIATTIYLIGALQIRDQYSAPGEMSARSLPLLCAALMYVTLAVVIFREWRAANASPKDAPESFTRPLLVVLATGAYTLLFLPLGYTISTLLFVSALFGIFGFELRRPVIFAASAIGVTSLFYILFGVLFGVRLPLLIGGVI